MGAGQVFVEDLKQALRAWRKDPRLPSLTTALYILISLPAFFPYSTTGPAQVINFLLLPAALFYWGYVGTERLWYLRIWRDEAMTLGDVWRFSWRLLGRFLALGLLLLPLFIPTMIWSIVEVVQELPRLTQEIERAVREGRDPSEIRPTLELGIFPIGLLVLNAVITLVVDILLTFVTPALTFTTNRATQAIRIGLRTLRDQWPRSAMYAFIPPLAALITLRFLPFGTLPVWLHVTLTGIGVTLLLLFKGATASFYLRSHDVPQP